MTSDFTPFLLAGLAVVSVFLGLSALLTPRTSSKERARQLSERITMLSGPGSETLAAVQHSIVRHESMSALPWLHRFLENLRFARNLDRLRTQAKVKTPVSVFLLFSAVLAFFGHYVADFLYGSMILKVILPVLGALAPFWYLRRLKRKRMFKFQQQLPDALDLVARALRAGHSFGAALKLICDEFEEPIGPEFAQVLDEINFGLSQERAFLNLLERVDCTDLKFFVVSINVQRETGGNLAEIVSSISLLIRDRFKLFGKIKVLSAEGRLSAIVLILLPFGVAGVLYLLNPDYISVLFTEQIGRFFIGGAAVQMFFGILWIRRMVRIEV